MLGVTLDRNSRVALARQIHSRVSQLILSGRLLAGAALPSTRELARNLGVSRNTGVEAYEMLWA